MIKLLRIKLRNVAVALAGVFGSDLRDYRTGEKIGRAFLIPWRGKVHVVGLQEPVRVIFLPQERLTFWKQEIGFTAHPPPDFPHEPRP